MEKLALFGGKPAVSAELAKTGIKPLVSRKAIGDIVAMLENGEISISPVVNKLEAEFSAYVGRKYAVCTCNGTTAIQTALFAAGIQPGDEVIVPSYTFWATAAPIIAAHGRPVFCDVDEATYNLDPKALERCITKRTKAVIVVHVWGNPCDMDEICRIAHANGALVIEDCAHAHGASYHGKKTGSLGDIAMFSFQGSKIMVAGEGGMLLCDDEKLYGRALALGHYERLGRLPETNEYRQYALTGLGFKHRMHPLGAAIARRDLETLDEMNALRNQNGKKLDSALSDLPFLSQQQVLDDAERVYAYHYARYHKEALGGVSLSTVLTALKAEGLSIGLCGYGHLHEAPLFVNGSPYGDGCPCFRAGEERGAGIAPVDLPVTKKLAEETFFLAPRFESSCDALVEAYANAYHKLYHSIEELIDFDAKHVALHAKGGNSINLL